MAALIMYLAISQRLHAKKHKLQSQMAAQRSLLTGSTSGDVSTASKESTRKTGFGLIQPQQQLFCTSASTEHASCQSHTYCTITWAAVHCMMATHDESDFTVTRKSAACAD